MTQWDQLRHHKTAYTTKKNHILVKGTNRLILHMINMFVFYLAYLAQRAMRAIVITLRPSWAMKICDFGADPIKKHTLHGRF